MIARQRQEFYRLLQKWRRWNERKTTPPCWGYTRCKQIYAYQPTFYSHGVYLQHGGVVSCSFQRCHFTPVLVVNDQLPAVVVIVADLSPMSDCLYLMIATRLEFNAWLWQKCISCPFFEMHFNDARQCVVASCLINSAAAEHCPRSESNATERRAVC